MYFSYMKEGQTVTERQVNGDCTARIDEWWMHVERK